MKILFITNGYPPDSIGGTEISTHLIAKEVQRKNIRVEVLCASEWEKGNKYWNGETHDIYEGISITRIKINWKLAPDPNRYLFNNPSVAQYLIKRFQSNRPDLIHVTSALTLSASVMTAASYAFIPVVLTLTDFWFICPRIKLIKGNGEVCNGQVSTRECLKCMLWDSNLFHRMKNVLPENYLMIMFSFFTHFPLLNRNRGLLGMAMNMNDRRKYLKAALNKTELIIVKSNYVKEVFSNNGIPSEKIVLLPDGEDQSWATSIKRQSSERSLRIGYIGHIIPLKGVHILVEAFRQIHGDISLDIFGDLSQDEIYSAHLKQMAAQDSRIHFWGKFPHNMIAKILVNMDLLVVPSIWPETFCHVIREGFIAGIPVIGSDIGAIPEAIRHNENGFLFTPGDINELRSYIQLIMANRNILIELQKKIPAVKTPEQHIDELIKIYSSIVKSHS